MLILIAKPKDEVVLGACQYLKDLYKDGALVGIYAAYFEEGHWVYKLGKTILKDNKLEEVGSFTFHDQNNIDFATYWKSMIDYCKGISYVINYGDGDIISVDDIENFNIEVTTLYCQNYFASRGFDTKMIEFSRCTFEYGEGIDGINMYDELIRLINEILEKYRMILEKDMETIKSE